MENTIRPLVSIIMPVHNSSQHLDESIESVLAQTNPDWELLAVENFSTDNSLEILKSYAKKDKRIKPLISDTPGAAEARNLALREAIGEYIAFLDSDDLWLPEKIEKHVGFMQENDIEFSYTPYFYIDDNSKPLGKMRLAPKEITYASQLKGSRIGCLTVVYKNDATPTVQIPNLKKRNDVALWLKALKTIPKGKRFNEPLSLYRISDDSLSSGSKPKLLKFHYRLYRESEKFSPLKSIYYVIWNIIVFLDIKLFKEKQVSSK